jgi:hypothetical protein
MTLIPQLLARSVFASADLLTKYNQDHPDKHSKEEEARLSYVNKWITSFESHLIKSLIELFRHLFSFCVRILSEQSIPGFE